MLLFLARTRFDRCSEKMRDCDGPGAQRMDSLPHVLETIALAFAPATESLKSHDFLPVQNGLMSLDDVMPTPGLCRPYSNEQGRKRVAPYRKACDAA